MSAIFININTINQIFTLHMFLEILNFLSFSILAKWDVFGETSAGSS